MKNPFKSDPPALPEVENYTYKPDHEYVVVLASQQAAKVKEGFKAVAINTTQHDGQMFVMERKKDPK